MAEEAVRLLVRFGRRYAAAVRLATLAPICVIALSRASPEHAPTTAYVVAAAAAWTCGYAWWLRRGRGSGPVALDVVVLLGLFASVFWTGAVEDRNTGWLRLLLTFACVTCQWHTPPLVGGAAALAAGGGAVVLLIAAGAVELDATLVTGTAWAMPAAALSRAAWVLVKRAAERADRMAAEAVRARGESLVAAAARAEERELANALHDTAATTLLMVGIGQVRSDADWLAPQARRDLDWLRSDSGRASPYADLVDLLRADLDATHLTVEFDAPARLRLPFDVARAIADATRETLTNVRRHAGTTRATVRLRGNEGALRLDVIDRGKGFSPTDVPATRRGIRESVSGRMTRVGGTATITSTEGEGTLVRLEWRVGDERLVMSDGDERP
ncbi:sensor histidine kinase [Nonomuraea glycinis]|uniref:sensor histidine kinase n=1 Tax=Nonomuraea glycinis TaxID=2047744 RepID=UPI0033B641B2